MKFGTAFKDHMSEYLPIATLNAFGITPKDRDKGFKSLYFVQILPIVYLKLASIKGQYTRVAV
jgi:hypothetical protein